MKPSELFPAGPGVEHIPLEGGLLMILVEAVDENGKADIITLLEHEAPEE